jgi:hypothetical protein
MTELRVNPTADFYVALEDEITGANASNDGTTGNASISPALLVGYYNASLPTVTDGAPCALQLDSSGRVLVGSIAGNVTVVGTGTLAVQVDAALPAGDNNIGNVDIASALPAGTNNIGDVDVASTVEPTHKTLALATGTAASSGDNTILDISGLAGYSSGDRIVITALRIQNESGTATTAIIKDGSTNIARIYTGGTAGTGVDRQYETGRELRLSADADLVFNLSGANSMGYSIEYFLETP